MSSFIRRLELRFRRSLPEDHPKYLPPRHKATLETKGEPLRRTNGEGTFHYTKGPRKISGSRATR